MSEPEVPLALWCTRCEGTRDTRAMPMRGSVTLYRCGQCGSWIRCPVCMAIRSSVHECTQ